LKRAAHDAFAALALAAALACAREAPPAPPGLELLARAEARLAREEAALAPLLDHAGMLFPVAPEALAAYLAPVHVHGAGADLALGGALEPEPHGGGVLRLLFDHWRPEGRAPGFDDRYPFANGAPALGELYAAYRQQLVLPEAADALPRMRFRFGLPGGRVHEVERDAWKLLGLLLEREPDLAAPWTNRAGEPLSVARLLERVRAHYLAGGPPAADPLDHGELHRVELLVAYGRGLEEVREHFLARELAQRDHAPRDASFLLAHQAESLGRLLEAGGLAWSADDARRAREWLAWLERERFRDVAREDLESLCHLARGLRAVRAQAAKLARG
jgi:hypothetical protein